MSLESFRKRLILAFIHDIDTEYLYDIQKNKDKIRLKLSGFTFQFIKYRLRTCLQLVLAVFLCLMSYISRCSFLCLYVLHQQNGASFASCPTSADVASFASCPTSAICSFLCLMSYISRCSFLCLMSYISRCKLPLPHVLHQQMAASFASCSASVSIFFPNIYTQCYI